MRRAIVGIASIFAVLTAGCSAGAGIGAGIDVAIQVRSSSAPYSEVIAGHVSAMVPEGWEAVPAANEDDSRGGFLASPEPDAWRRLDGSTTGMSATWVDATRIGVPSDFYAMVAQGSLPRLTGSRRCRATDREVLLDDGALPGDGIASAADYMARVSGTCRVQGAKTRWSYFVAAPGFGPVRRLGIPSSGLYLVMAVMPAEGNAQAKVDWLIRRTRFGDASVRDFLKVARTPDSTPA